MSTAPGLDSGLNVTINFSAYELDLSSTEEQQPPPVSTNPEVALADEENPNPAGTKSGSNGNVSGTDNSTEPSQSGSEVTVYTVAKGDNLTKIAERFGVSPQALSELNKDRIKPDGTLLIGERLMLPGHAVDRAGAESSHAHGAVSKEQGNAQGIVRAKFGPPAYVVKERTPPADGPALQEGETPDGDDSTAKAAVVTFQGLANAPIPTKPSTPHAQLSFLPPSLECREPVAAVPTRPIDGPVTFKLLADVPLPSDPKVPTTTPSGKNLLSFSPPPPMSREPVAPKPTRPIDGPVTFDLLANVPLSAPQRPDPRFPATAPNNVLLAQN